MAGYLPPTEDLPIFDDSVFQAGNAPLTYNDAVKEFLKYPHAQGKEFLQEIEVDGTAVFQENIVINNNSSITSNTTGFVTSITPSLISTTDTNAFGDPLDVIITPNNIIVHNGNGANQTTTINANDININNNDTGGSTDIQANSMTFTDFSSGTTALLNATNFALQDSSVNHANIISSTGMYVLDTATNASVNVNSDQIILADSTGTTLSLTSETISNVANIQNLLSETTQYLDLRSGYDAPNNTFQSDIHMWKQNLSLSTNNTQNVICLQDNGLFGGYTIPSQNWDFEAGTLPTANWIFSPNGSMTLTNNPSGGFFTTHQVSNTNAYINTSAPQMGLGTASSTWLNIQSSSLNNNCPIPATSDSSTIIPTTNWVQNRFNTFLSTVNTFIASQTLPSIVINGSGVTANQTVAIGVASTPSRCLDINTNGGSNFCNFFIRGGTTINGSAYGAPGGTGTMVAFQTGQSAFQNYAGASASQGFRFSSVTNVATDKILGIIPYNTPATTDSSQNLGTTLWSQTTFAPITVTPITVSGGGLAVPLNAVNRSYFSCTLTGNLTTMSIGSAINNSRFTIYLTVSGTGLILSKALSANIVNNLAGDVVLINGSKWLFEGVTQGGTPTFWLTITNMT